MHSRNQQRTHSVWPSGCRPTLVITIAFILGTTCLSLVTAQNLAPGKSDPGQRHLKAQDRLVQAENRKRTFPLGHIPVGARERALTEIQQAASPASPSGILTPVWDNIGPAPIGNSPYAGPGLASGRVAALA